MGIREISHRGIVEWTKSRFAAFFHVKLVSALDGMRPVDFANRKILFVCRSLEIASFRPKSPAGVRTNLRPLQHQTCRSIVLLWPITSILNHNIKLNCTFAIADKSFEGDKSFALLLEDLIASQLIVFADVRRRQTNYTDCVKSPPWTHILATQANAAKIIISDYAPNPKGVSQFASFVFKREFRLFSALSALFSSIQLSQWASWGLQVANKRIVIKFTSKSALALNCVCLRAPVAQHSRSIPQTPASSNTTTTTNSIRSEVRDSSWIGAKFICYNQQYITQKQSKLQVAQSKQREQLETVSGWTHCESIWPNVNY